MLDQWKWFFIKQLLQMPIDRSGQISYAQKVHLEAQITTSIGIFFSTND